MDIFLISFLGSILGGFLVNFIRLRAAPDPIPANSEEVAKFNKPKTIIAASTCVFIAWFCLIIVLFFALLPIVGIENNYVLACGMVAFFIMAIAYALLSFHLKCTNCYKRLFSQVAEKPPFSIKFKGLEGWSSIVLQVLFLSRFTCMHCGKKYAVE